ncbi:nucleoside-triphosphatase [Clostridium sp. Cult2]|uniref:nucleoside-triphosphatase n=1 Tax=Clostridium sp. Cult2 TaxID=2079003 RepID=UPI001F27C863
MNNLFLTGKIGVGKSTILKNALKELNLSIGGYVTERIFEGYYRKYIVKSLYDNMEEYIIVRVDSRDNSKEGFMEAFENGVISILDKSLKHRDLIVLDELGCVENDIDIFTSKVFELLNSKKIVFGILKDDYCSFLNDIRSRDDVIIIRITEENRDYILDHIINILESFIHKTNC